MSIEKMTYMSNSFFAAAGILGLAAVVLFVAFDIPKCWEMITGRHFASMEKNIRQEAELKKVKQVIKTEKLSGFEFFEGSEETLLLDSTGVKDTCIDDTVKEEICIEDTVLLGTHDFDIIQNIIK